MKSFILLEYRHNQLIMHPLLSHSIAQNQNVYMLLNMSH